MSNRRKNHCEDGMKFKRNNHRGTREILWS